MTITELANELGVSTQAVYKRLQRGNIDVATLKENGTNNLSPEGVDTIRLMYKDSPSVNKRTRKVREDTLSTSSKVGLTQMVLDQGDKITRLETENEMLRADVAEWKQRYDDLLRRALAIRVEANTLTDPQNVEGENVSQVTHNDTSKGFFKTFFSRIRK